MGDIMEPGSYLQSLTVIFVILGFLILVLLGIKRYGVRFGLSSLKQHRELTIEAHLSLGPKRDVCVVRYKDKKFLLGATDSGITLLAVVDESSTDNKVAANKSTQTTLTS